MSYNNYPETDWSNQIIKRENGTPKKEKEKENNDEQMIISFSNVQEEYGDWCSLTVAFDITTKIKKGEGPIAIARRINQIYQQQLDKYPQYSDLDMTFDWYDIVIQNWEYFDGIVDQENRDNPLYWTNAKTKEGDLIYLKKYSVIYRPCQYEYESAGDLAEKKGMEIDLGNNENAYFYSKGSGYGKMTLGASFGVDTEYAKALVDVSLVGSIKSDFLIDNDPNTPVFSGEKATLDLKVKALAQGKVGKLNTGVEANLAYDILENNAEVDISGWFKWGYEEKQELKSEDGKHKLGASLGFNFTLRKFKYEADKNRTTISFNIKAFAKLNYTFRLHPLIKFYVGLEAGADADFVLVLPGDFEPEYIEDTDMIDFEKTIDKVNLILPPSDTLYPKETYPAITLPRQNW